MKRHKRHRVKLETAEPSTSSTKLKEDHDLAYFVHDRVELMHQVFSSLKAKEIKAIAPECIRDLSLDDIEEMCLEELLGISSKRLCAVLDGAPPPSDTDSSEDESGAPSLEAISLDSLSSSDLVSSGSKKKKKHRRHKTRSQSKTKKSRAEVVPTAHPAPGAGTGVTVLELLELQARARAIRAQLTQQQANDPPVSRTSSSSSSGVEVKEEPPAVVTISSEDSGEDKPDVRELQRRIQDQNASACKDSQSKTQTVEKQNAEKRDKSPHSKSSKKKKKNKRDEKEKSDNAVTTERLSDDNGRDTKSQDDKENTTEQNQKQQTIIKRNDFTITMNNTQQSKRKIKLNRNKITASVPSVASTKPVERVTSTENVQPKQTDDDKVDNNGSKVSKVVKIKKKSSKNKKRIASVDDNDEITLVLSDSEKMDLLEDLDRNHLDQVSSSSDSEPSSSDSSGDSSESDNKNDSKDSNYEKIDNKNYSKDSNTIPTKDNYSIITPNDTESIAKNVTNNGEQERDEAICGRETEDAVNDVTNIEGDKNDDKGEGDEVKDHDSVVNKVSSQRNYTITVASIDDIPLRTEVNEEVSEDIGSNKDAVDNPVLVEPQEVETVATKDDVHCSSTTEKDVTSDSLTKESSNVQKTPSEDGELTDKSSSEVEAVDVRPEVVCISDEETESQEGKRKKKKSKKEKKAKKNKKKDFRKDFDQNFYKENSDISVRIDVETAENDSSVKDLDEVSKSDSIDDIYEILELSDDSSCYEVEGVSVLSKEPTTDEIEALSAKIDEFERSEVVTDEEIRKHDTEAMEEDITWKDRYLGSKKVKTVLTTANIMNALRKRNRELKKKLLESKNVKQTEEMNEGMTEGITEGVNERNDIELGTIDHYNTLEGSTKYVDPVVEKETSVPLTHEMKKDAKQLLKMYKRLLKYNDMNKKKDKKKKSKKKKKDNGVASCDK